LTHHPVFLDPPDTLTAAPGIMGVPYAAASAGVALVACHTNLDRSPAGADALPMALGLRVVGPLESSPASVATIVTYAPQDSVETVLAALHEAGAGRIGRYADCAFVGTGEGRFVGLEGSSPSGGEPGRAQTQDEARIEVVCEPGAVDAAMRAVRVVHPYEEPVVLTAQTMLSRGVARMGRVCEAPGGSTVGSVAAHVGRTLGVSVRIWGDETAPLSLVGVAPGSGRSLIADARRAGCRALITGELRYHEALDAAECGLAVIEAGHDATEWPLVPVLAAGAARTTGLDGTAIVVDGPRVHWWTTEGV
jgi:hypothetical protein